MIVPPLRRTTTGRAAALAAAVLLLLSACGGEPAGEAQGAAAPGDAPSSAPAGSEAPPASSPGQEDGGAATPVSLTVRGGEVDGPTRAQVPLGQTVALTVTSDVADEVHVHGYDRTLELVPGTPATVEFPADIPGVFEVELHDSGLALTSLQVQ